MSGIVLASVPLEGWAAVNPGPLFVLSLVPYLAFLSWASKVRAFPKVEIGRAHVLNSVTQ